MLKSKRPPSFSLGQREDAWARLPPHPVNNASKPPARWRRGIFISVQEQAEQMTAVMTKKNKSKNWILTNCYGKLQ